MRFLKNYVVETLSVLLCLFFCFKGYSLTPDSLTYIDMSPIRTGGYPLFLNFFIHVFGDMKWAFYAQTLLTFTALPLISSRIQNIFGTGKLLSFLILFASASNYSGDIISEGLAYPLFLLCSYHLMGYIQDKTLTSFIKFSIFACLVCFVRQQYIIFYMVGGALWMYGCLKSWAGQKKIILSLLMSFMTLFVGERGYHYIYHGSFSSTPFMWFQLSVLPIYLSEDSDADIFKDPKVKETFLKIHQKMASNPAIALAKNQYLEKRFFNAINYSQIYDEICYRSVVPSVERSSYEIEHLCQEFTLPLIKKHMAHYIKALFRTPLTIFGTLWIMMIIGLACLMIQIFKDPDDRKIILTSCLSLSILNIILIIFMQTLLNRYTYTCNSLFFAVMLSYVLGCSSVQSTKRSPFNA